MAIADVLRIFHDLKQSGGVRDYMIFGSVAAMVHTEPFYTEDLDIVIAVASDNEYVMIFNRLAALGRIEGHSIILHDTPVEIFPVDISPIIHDAVAHAARKRVDGVLVKVAPPEHLLLEALRVNRPKDRLRAGRLLEVVDHAKLLTLILRLDHDGTLRRRYEAITRPLD